MIRGIAVWRVGAVMAAACLGEATAACAPTECADRFDCPLGWSCNVDGACVAGQYLAREARGDEALASAGADVPPAGVTAVGPNGLSVDVAPGGDELPSTLDGHIANLETAGAAWGVVTPAVGWGNVELLIEVLDRPSTFVALHHVPLELLLTPGDHILGKPTTLESPVGQACNYDTAEYDEVLDAIVIHVPEARPGDARLPVTFDFRAPNTEANGAVSFALTW